MLEKFVLLINLVEETSSFGRMPLIRCPLRKADHFQKTKQENTLFRSTLIWRYQLLHSYYFLCSFLSLTYTHTHTPSPHTHYHKTITFHNILDFQIKNSWNRRWTSWGGGQEKYIGCLCGGGCGGDSEIPPSKLCHCDRSQRVRFHRFNCTLPGFVVKCTNMPLILPLKYYISWKL